LRCPRCGHDLEIMVFQAQTLLTCAVCGEQIEEEDELDPQ